ncbi:EMB2654 [Symbiodinium natans]|uniref:EMB2654 protein n=1 Tax=Symbiodinium natans TaxID=878477 RepID=A0A812IBC6_9DINO|nr:EMB2654 [Symbiodinium natans]
MAGWHRAELEMVLTNVKRWGPTASKGNLATLWSRLGKASLLRICPDLAGFNAALTACHFGRHFADPPAFYKVVCERRSCWPFALCLAGETSALVADVVTRNAALSAAFRGSWRHGLGTARRFQAEGLEPDSVTYNTAAHALCKKDQWQLTLQLLHDSTEIGLRPSKVSFAALAAVAWRRRDWRQALWLLRHMEDEQVEADAVSCALALRCLEGCCRWPHAILLLERRGLDATCLNVALSAVSAGPEAWPRGLCLVARALQRGPAPDSVSCSTIASACARATAPSAALRLLREFQAFRIRLGTSAYNAVLASAIGDWALGVEIVEEMGQKAVPRDVITCGAAVAAFSVDSAVWMKAVCFQRLVNTAIVTASCGACANAHEWSQAVALLGQLRRRSLQEDEKAQGAAVAARELQGWRASLVELAAQAEPQLPACNAAVTACERTACWHAALSLLASAPGARMAPDAISANAGVSACRLAWARALHLLSQQAQLDSSSSELVAVAAEASGQGAAVARLLEDLEGRVMTGALRQRAV